MGTRLLLRRRYSPNEMKTPWKPTKEQLTAAADKTVADVIAPDLRVLFSGINPGLYTAAIGHHFGRPGNRFWKVLHLAGFTPEQFSPFEEHRLLEHGIGVTNVVPRATATAAELTADEIRAGAVTLEEKVLAFKPSMLAVVGVQAFRVGFGKPKATVGAQNERIGDTRVWLLPNPSGLQAHYQLADLVTLFRELREATLK